MFHDILNMILLVGCIQGVMFSVFAFAIKRYRSKSTIFLALLILVLSVNNFQYLLRTLETVSEAYFYSHIYIPFETLIIVFYFFYIKFFLYPKDKVKSVEKLFYLPFIVFSLITFIFKIIYFSGNFTAEHEGLVGKIMIFHTGFGILFSFLIILMTYKLFRQFEKEQQKGITQIPKTKLSWLKISVFFFFTICVYWLYLHVREMISGVYNEHGYYLLWIGISVMIYALGHVGIYRFGILQEQLKIKEFSLQQTALRKLHFTEENSPYINKLERLMRTEKNFLDSNLTLETVSEKLGISKSHLSRILKSKLGIGFSEYINRLRVEEAKVFLENPDFENYTLIAVSLESGFNSKSSFYSAFRKYMGCTPSEFREKQIAARMSQAIH